MIGVSLSVVSGAFLVLGAALLLAVVALTRKGASWEPETPRGVHSSGSTR